VTQRTFLARSRLKRPAYDEHARAWREAQLADIASGRRTTALGIRPCYCRRHWKCDLCQEPFVCWDVWPFLWQTLPGKLHGKKLCRRCYGQKLLEALDSCNGQIDAPPPPTPPPAAGKHRSPLPVAAPAALPVVKERRFRHIFRRR
jgi:hypothetical protein